MQRLSLTLGLILAVNWVMSQHEHHRTGGGYALPVIKNVEPQPLISQALRLKEALAFLGSSLSTADELRLDSLQHLPFTQQSVQTVQEVMDPYCLAFVSINPEGRVRVDRGPATPHLIQGGWTSFLVKVLNEAGGTARLVPESPNALPPQHSAWVSLAPKVLAEHVITEGQSVNRFLDIQMYGGRPLQPNLSGFRLEYAVVQIYSKDAGQREAEIGFNAGQGTQDIGFRNATHFLFHIKPSVKVRLRVRDDDGSPAMASFVITDSINRTSGRLSGVYPLPSRRVAAFDEYPDFFFQPQIYRKDGEYVSLAPGKYHVRYGRGPEYIPQTRQIEIPDNTDTVELAFQLQRWINTAKLGWYSGDHHVHASGCSHYDSPEEGVKPQDMWRQALGEDLSISAVLTWGPSWYHQKGYFTGKDHALSNEKNLIRYDVEVSGFPSSHAGHVVLLRVSEDDYPGTSTIEQWPSFTLPILKWGRAQGGVVGYAHTGQGMAPQQPTTGIPNYVIPKMDWNGANEYVMAVAHDAVDFISAGDTPVPYELNMWYHALNCGFRTRISGETDFPCLSDEKIGQGRSYYNSGGTAVNYDRYVAALKTGRSYVSDGRSHLMDFSVNGIETGTKNSEITLKKPGKLTISANVAAFLPEHQTPEGMAIAKSPLTSSPYWHVERGRIGTSRNVRVELIVNGFPVDSTEVLADGQLHKVAFSYNAGAPAWIALRILGSSHTNPFFINMNGKGVRDKKSAQWCLDALNHTWTLREPQIRQEEKAAAREAYDLARRYYQSVLDGN